MKSYLQSLVFRLKVLKRHIKYIQYFKQLLNLQHIKNTTAPGEKEYINFWKQLYPHVEPYSYRLFRHYCGDTPYIVPEDIGHSFIETKLNPNRFTPFYEDKNILPILLPKEYLPKTTMCRIHGGRILDGNSRICPIDANSDSACIYSYLGGIEQFILKPSIDSAGGRRVMMFVPKEHQYVSHDHQYVLDGRFLYQYGNDWVIQHAVKQHELLRLFCPTSVNTIRVNTYRSYKDEQIYIISAALRVGRKGAIVDNGHSGGGLIKVDLQTGELGHEVIDHMGYQSNVFNGINFADKLYYIPLWEQIKSFCVEIASYNKHCRLIAMDVAICENGKPILLEWNVKPYSFSYWIPLFTGALPLGDKTCEIVEYCSK